MNDLSIVDSKNQNMGIWESTDDLKQIKDIYGKNLSIGEFNTLVQMGRATGLNPFLKEIWAVKYGDNPAQIFIGRDGYRKSAQRHPLYDYHIADAVYSADKFAVINGEIGHEYNLLNRGNLIGAYCFVQRKGSSRPTYVFVDLKEYSTGKSLWNIQTGKPATMIKKVAEAQALRAAFQELFSGTYSEFEEFVPESQVILNSKKDKGVDGLKKKLGMAKDDIIDYDGDTGEIIEPLINEKTDQNAQSSNQSTLETIEFLMERATNSKDLMEAMKMAKDFSSEDKKKVSALFNKCQEELKASQGN